MGRHARRARHRRSRRGPSPVAFTGLFLAGWSLALVHEATAHHHPPQKVIADREPAPPNRVQPKLLSIRTSYPTQEVLYKKPPPPPEPRGELVVKAALTRRGLPYVWGDKGPQTFDCSGLVQWSWKQVGVQLGPDTYTQIHDGVPATGPPQPGDLIFPASEMGANGPAHVVLAVSATEAIEAPGRGMTVRLIPMPAIGAARRIV